MPFPDVFDAVGAGEVVASSDMNVLRRFVSGLPWLNVVGYGAICDNDTHTLSEVYGSLAAAQVDYPFVTSLTQDLNWAAFQKAESVAGTAGGGRILVPGPMAVSIQHQGAAGEPWALTFLHDTIWVQGVGPHAAIRNAYAGNCSLFALGGDFKAGGEVDASNAFHEFQPFGWGTTASNAPTVYALSGTIAKGDTTITLATPAHANNLAVGDWIVIRTGQRIAGNLAQPDAEINRVKAKNATTGDITLMWPTKKVYAQEYFISGTNGFTSTSVTANAAPFGVSKITDRIIRNIRVTDLHIEQENDWHIFYGRTMDNVVIDVTARAQGSGLSNLGTHRNLRINADLEIYDSVFNWWAGGDTGCSDFEIRGRVTSDVEPNYVHIHEGSAKGLVDVQMSCPSTTGDKPLVSCRSGCYDITIKGDYSGGGDTSVIWCDQDTRGGVIDDVTVHSQTATNAVAVDAAATGWKVGIVKTDLRVNVAGTNELTDGERWITATEMGLQSGTPTFALNNFKPTWKLPSSGNSSVGLTFRVPPAWRYFDIYVHWTNDGAGSGNVDLKMNGSEMADGETITGGVDHDQTVTVAAPAQNVLKVSKLPNTITCTPNQVQWLNVYRTPGGTDTLGNAIAIFGILLRRAG